MLFLFQKRYSTKVFLRIFTPLSYANLKIKRSHYYCVAHLCEGETYHSWQKHKLKTLLEKVKYNGVSVGFNYCTCERAKYSWNFMTNHYKPHCVSYTFSWDHLKTQLLLGKKVADKFRLKTVPRRGRFVPKRQSHCLVLMRMLRSVIAPLNCFPSVVCAGAVLSSTFHGVPSQNQLYCSRNICRIFLKCTTVGTHVSLWLWYNWHLQLPLIVSWDIQNDVSGNKF